MNLSIENRVEIMQSENPFEQFRIWFDAASRAGIVLPESCVLATVDSTGAPQIRTVLLKDFDARGFVFFTNYESNKGIEILSSPRVSLLFHWASMERQIRINGSASKTTRQESEMYFASRPRESQIGAWASSQSREIASRQVLEESFQKFSIQFEGKSVTCPPHWGGYRIHPEQFEFWQGRPSRLHDRIVVTRVKNSNSWGLKRLSP